MSGISVLNGRNVIRVGEFIQLFNKRADVPTTHLWDFGYGGTGTTTDANPSVSWSTVGRKTITYAPNVGRNEKKVDYIYVVPDYTSFDGAHTHNIVFSGATITIDGSGVDPYWFDFSSYTGGGHVFYMSGTYSGDTIMMRRPQGVSGNPNIFTNKANEVCTINTFTSNRPYGIHLDTHHDLWFVGNNDPNNKYGIVMNKGIGMWSSYMGATTPVGRDTKFLSTKVVSIYPSTSMSAAGHGPKNTGVDRVQSLSYNAWDDFHMMHNHLEASRVEGAYMGVFHYFYNDGYYPHTMKRARVAWNEVRGNGWDGLQLSCADEASSMHDNICIGNALSGASGQNYGILANSGWKGEIYNNLIVAGSNGVGGGLQAINYSNSRVYNNIMYSPSHFGIFSKTMGNDYGSQSTYVNTDATMVVKYFNNTFFTNYDCVRYDKDLSSTEVPVYEFHMRNNICRYGSLGSSGVFFENCTITTKDVSDNYASDEGSASLFFEDIANGDYNIPSDSPALSAGADLSAFYAETELGLYDHNGYEIDTGNWHAGAMQATIADVIAPVFSTATVENAEPTKIILTYDEVLDATSIPANTDYSPNLSKTVSNVAIADNVVTLTVNSPYISTDSIEISYTKGTNPIRDAALNESVSLVDETVTNNITLPTLISATIYNAEPTKIILVYDKLLDESSIPDVGDYIPSDRTVTNIGVSGYEVTVTVNSAYLENATIIISYAVGSNPIQDLIGNDALLLNNQTVVNRIFVYTSVNVLDALVSVGKTNTIDYSVSAGTNRILVGWVNHEGDGNATGVEEATYGGQPMNLITKASDSIAWDSTSIYILDDAGIELAIGTEFTTTGSVGDVPSLAMVCFEGVEQNNPVRDFDSIGNASVDPGVSDLAINAGDMVVGSFQSSAGGIATAWSGELTPEDAEFLDDEFDDPSQGAYKSYQDADTIAGTAGAVGGETNRCPFCAVVLAFNEAPIYSSFSIRTFLNL